MLYFFFNLTIKLPDRARWCHSAVLIHVLPIAYCDFESSIVFIYLEQNSIGKLAKTLKPVAFLLVF